MAPTVGRFLSPFTSGLDSPALGVDGSIYGSLGGGLYAFDEAGTNRWVARYPYSSGGSPAIGNGETILVAVTTQAGRPLSAFSAEGVLAWRALGGPMYGTYTTPAIDAGGTIYYCVS